MSYSAWSVVFGEQPSAAKWNLLGSNDSSFNDGTGLPTAGSQATQVTTSETTTSTSYTDLATAGPAVTVTVGSTGMLLVGVGCNTSSSTTGQGNMSYTFSGANTLAVNDRYGIITSAFTGGATNGTTKVFLHESLNPGSTTITAKYKTNTGTETFYDRIVWAISI